MYVCMYVCMHVCMYVCMYLCVCGEGRQSLRRDIGPPGDANENSGRCPGELEEKARRAPGKAQKSKISFSGVNTNRSIVLLRASGHRLKSTVV